MAVPISVLHVVPSINRGTGGPALSVTGLARFQAQAGLRVTLASLDYPEHGSPADTTGVATISVAPSPLGKLLRGWSPRFARKLAAPAPQGLDVVHNHGLWMYPGIYARRLALGQALPLVISPRGMLDHWSLGYNPWRKRLALAAYERRNLRAAALFHATSDMEAEAIRRAGLRQPIAIIPNATEAAAARGPVPDRVRMESRFPALRGRRWLLYMGRLHPKKGLPLLLQAWQAVAAHGWHLLVAGPDLTGYRDELAATLAADSTLSQSVTLLGMLEGDDKACALGHSDILVLPTLSENFGIVVLEALQAGMPVITTTAAPWRELQTHGCGWWVEPSVPALRGAIEAAVSLPSQQLHAMGERARQLVAVRYTWDAAAARMADVYRWIRSGGDAPDCVALP